MFYKDPLWPLWDFRGTDGLWEHVLWAFRWPSSFSECSSYMFWPLRSAKFSSSSVSLCWRISNTLLFSCLQIVHVFHTCQSIKWYTYCLKIYLRDEKYCFYCERHFVFKARKFYGRVFYWDESADACADWETKPTLLWAIKIFVESFSVSSQNKCV